MSDKKMSKKNKFLTLMMFIIFILFSSLPFRTVRNTICSVTNHTICIKTDFGSLDYEAKDLLELKKQHEGE